MAEDRIDELARVLEDRRAVVLTGAGCSTESGIPDYRGPEGRLRSRVPMTYGEFVSSETGRRRYWARSAVGWKRFSRARPNAAHGALAELEAMGRVVGVITQNVDGLHQEAGSRTVLELHGSLARVRCLDCRTTVSRWTFQERLEALNPGFGRGTRVISAPDGDADLPDGMVQGFRIPSCGTCGGVLKPDVVFFGESVPRPRLDRAWELFDRAEILLVLGSSLSVYSGRRFVYRAAEEARPILIVNDGETRGDELAHVKVEGRLGALLPRLVREFAARAADPVDGAWPM